MSKARDLADFISDSTIETAELADNAVTSAKLDETDSYTVAGLTVSGNVSVDGGTIKLDGNYPVGTANVALGNTALDDGSLTGSYNTAIGAEALTANTSGNTNVAVGNGAMFANQTGVSNVAVGSNAFGDNLSGDFNVAIGRLALQNSTTADNNIAIGYNSLGGNLTGSANVAIGHAALDASTAASNNTAVGYQALTANTSGTNNTAVGRNSLAANQTGNSNVAIGTLALDAITDSSSSVAIGHEALTSKTGGFGDVAVGRQALHSLTTGQCNTAVGSSFGGYVGGSLETGSFNTFIGTDAGHFITTGSNNTIIGGFNGNENGLDIRTSSNYIVLSDGSGNPRGIFDGSGNFLVGTTDNTLYNNTTGGGANILSDGLTTIARETAATSDTVLVLNDTGAGGSIQQFRKDGSEVGSIGTNSGDLFIGSGDTGVRFISGADQIIPWNISGNTTKQDAIDIGKDTQRFKDLYLSGGVYLGGTGSANKLDDYEEGDYTATATPDSGSISLNGTFNQLGYTKIGRVVTVTGQLVVGSVSSPSGVVRVNLPFTVANLTDIAGRSFTSVVSFFNGTGITNGNYDTSLRALEGTSELLVYGLDGISLDPPGDWFGAGTDLFINITYFASA